MQNDEEFRTFVSVICQISNIYIYTYIKLRNELTMSSLRATRKKKNYFASIKVTTDDMFEIAS